jgi:uncharacterized RDD family membrane protein YckC
MFCSNCGTENNADAKFCTSCGNALAVPVVVHAGSPTTPPARPVQYAGFWMRFAALLIDRFVLAIPGVAIAAGFIVQLVMRYQNVEDFELGDIWTIVRTVATLAGLIFLLQWLYFALMESSTKQATLGKILLGIKVTDMNGQRISFARASGRFFGKILSGLILSIGFMMAGFTEKKQALHDMLAGTLVVRSY